jgi:hypothetical protein
MLLLIFLYRMEKNQLERQQLIREVLSGSDNLGEVGMTCAVRAWEQLATHLSYLIGEAGFCALYLRALHLANAPEALSDNFTTLRTTAVLIQQLRQGLAAIEPTQARMVNAAVLETFTKLLAGLIGEALTTRLLNTAWADRSEGNRT